MNSADIFINTVFFGFILDTQHTFVLNVYLSWKKIPYKKNEEKNATEHEKCIKCVW